MSRRGITKRMHQSRFRISGPVPGTNMLRNSSDMSSSEWVLVRGTYDNGTKTFTATLTGNTYYYIEDRITDDYVTGRQYTASIEARFVPGSTAAHMYILLRTNNAVLPGGVSFADIENGVIGTLNPLHDSSAIVAVGDGWYRFSVTFTAVGDGEDDVRFSLADKDNDQSASLTAGHTIELRRPQIEEGAAFTFYDETTGA